MDILRREHIMATQTRRTTQQSVKSHSATLKASIVMACCGLVLWSAVAAHAAITANGFTLNGLNANGISTNGITINGLSTNGAMNGININGITLNGMIHDTTSS